MYAIYPGSEFPIVIRIRFVGNPLGNIGSGSPIGIANILLYMSSVNCLTCLITNAVGLGRVSMAAPWQCLHILC
mgnify:CR=1 FL=1